MTERERTEYEGILSCRTWEELYDDSKALGLRDGWSPEVNVFFPVESDDFKDFICTMLEDGHGTFVSSVAAIVRSWLKGGGRYDCVIRVDDTLRYADETDFLRMRQAVADAYKGRCMEEEVPA